MDAGEKEDIHITSQGKRGNGQINTALWPPAPQKITEMTSFLKGAQRNKIKRID